MHKRAVLVAIGERLESPPTSSDGKAIDPECLVKLRELGCAARDAAHAALKRCESLEGADAVNIYERKVVRERALEEAYLWAYAAVRGVALPEAEAEIRAAEKQEGKHDDGD
jgi:hypothetical protein